MFVPVAPCRRLAFLVACMPFSATARETRQATRRRPLGLISSPLTRLEHSMLQFREAHLPFFPQAFGCGSTGMMRPMNLERV